MRIARALLLSLAWISVAAPSVARPSLEEAGRAAALRTANEIFAASSAAFSFAGYDGDPYWRLEAAQVSYELADTPDGLTLTESLELRLTQKFEDHVEPHLSIRQFVFRLEPGAAVTATVADGGEDLGGLIPFEVSTLGLRCATSCFSRRGRERQGQAEAADAPLRWSVDAEHEDKVAAIGLLLAVSEQKARRLADAIMMLTDKPRNAPKAE